jgi:hypothetical protein
MSLFNSLDNGIENINYDSDNSDDMQLCLENLNFKNPFFSRDKIILNDNYVKLIDLTQREFYCNFSSVYALCLKNEGEIDNSFYSEIINTKDLNNFVNNLELVNCDFKLLNNPIHKSQVVLIDSYYLKLFNKFINFGERELVIPLINISLDTYDKYLKQFTEIFKFEDYLAVKVANDFYQNGYANIHYLTEILKSNDSTDYWTRKNNTKLNITNKFINRTFNLSECQKINDMKLKNILEEVNKMPEEGDAYLSYIYRKSVYVDVSSSIKKNGYSLYRIDNNLDITLNEINHILDYIDNDYEFYSLAISILISKKYCHFVLNNVKFMSRLLSYKCNNLNEINLIERYIPAFQYAMGYSWLSLYSEECIKKSRIDNNDRFVFRIDQASMLPFFPLKISRNDFRYNPYISLLVNDEVLDLENNLMGVQLNLNKSLGVNSLLEFKRRFNIFLMSDENLNIFDNVNMNNLGITGSVIPACITRYNPLMDKFLSLDRYFHEYYATSDIDIMCNLENDFDYIDRFYEFFDKIRYNCEKLGSNAEFSCKKIAAIIVNESYIRNNIVDDSLNYEFILSNLDNENVKYKFYTKYKENKIQKNFNYIKDPRWKDNIYNEYFEILPINNIKIIFARTKKDWENLKKQNENDEESLYDDEEIEYEYQDSDDFLFKIYENIKFNIKSQILNHDIEFFKIKYPTSFFSTVSNFHLPCVRGYYDCNDVYLLPSCITAAMTLINLDYKYFAGSHDPIEIINKYRLRGYSTPLNDSEKIRFISYSSKVEKWNKLYGGIDVKDKASVNRVYGYLSPNDNFFNPRLEISDTFSNLKPVDLTYNNINSYNCDDDTLNFYLLNLIYPKFKGVDNLNDVCDLEHICKNGYIKNVRKWYFDAIYENSYKN